MNDIEFGLLSGMVVFFCLWLLKSRQKASNEAVPVPDATGSLDSTRALWKNTEALYDYTDRMWRETDKLSEATAMIRRHEKVDYAACEGCGKDLPVIAFMTETDPRHICARCSPEAKAAGRGSYK
jgi:hypothetical protein